VTVNVVKGKEWSPQTLADLTARVHKYLGSDMRLQLVFRDDIPLEKSGKYRFAISTLHTPT
jgi:hypothetical protein